MDQLVPDLLKLGLPGVIIIVQFYVIRLLFTKYEERGREQLETAKTSQEDSRKAVSLISELTPILRESTEMAGSVHRLLDELRRGRRR